MPDKKANRRMAIWCHRSRNRLVLEHQTDLGYSHSKPGPRPFCHCIHFRSNHMVDSATYIQLCGESGVLLGFKSGVTERQWNGSRGGCGSVYCPHHALSITGSAWGAPRSKSTASMQYTVRNRSLLVLNNPMSNDFLAFGVISGYTDSKCTVAWEAVICGNNSLQKCLMQNAALCA